MPYIGKEPEHGNYQLLDALTAPSGVFDGSRTVFNLTADGVAVYPTSPTTLLISLGGVLQEPNSSYTVSGNQITFTTAPATSTTFFGVSLGDTLDIGTPSDGSVTVAKMAANSVDSNQYVDGSIDSAHIGNDQIDSQHYAATSIDNEHLADNAVDSDELAAGAVDIAHLSATGTASSSTFLRGDNAWAAPSGGPSQASQSAIEAETNEDTYPPPDLIKHSPGVAKAWASFGVDSTADASYNVASISDATGDWTITFTTAFSNGTYMTQNFLNRIASGGDDYIAISDTANAAGSCVLISWRISSQAIAETAEQVNMMGAWGDQ
jgi:hypothetical protein